ncbi:MAG: PAS domain-containing protein [Deltaproteobacteria bacterium]
MGQRLPLSDLKGVKQALMTREVIAASDPGDPRLSAASLRKYGIRSVLIAPLIVKGEAIGTLNFYCLSSAIEFTELQIDYARKVADSVSLAIENARLYGELQETERVAQRRLAEVLSIYAAAPVGLCFVDTNLRFVKVSNKLAAMNGPTVEEHVGRTVREMLPELADTVEPDYRRVLETGEPLEEVEFRGVRPATAGEVRDWLSSYYPVKDAGGRMLGVNAVVQDITERKRAERALQENERLLRDVLRNLPVGVWITDRHGKIIHVNPAGQAIWKGARYVGPEQFHKYKAWRLDTHEPVKPEGRALTRAVTKGEAILDQELEIETFDGEHKLISNSAIPLRNEQGEIQGAIAINLDITRQKKMEQELRGSNQELEQFAYVASHDLKEPLRMITGFLDLLQRRYQGKLDKDADEFIGFAVEGATRMHQLINDLLAFSRIGTKGKPLGPTAMEEVLAKSIRNLKKNIEETGGTIEHDPLPQVMGDEGQLVQLLQNLLANALKFTDDRKPEVRISVEEEKDKEDGFYRFSVQDNGIGIDTKQAKRIFTIFQRLHTRKDYPGTGIGLAICKKIVERHGGRIWAESKPGKGSRFYFDLPKI